MNNVFSNEGPLGPMYAENPFRNTIPIRRVQKRNKMKFYTEQSLKVSEANVITPTSDYNAMTIDTAQSIDADRNTKIYLSKHSRRLHDKVLFGLVNAMQWRLYYFILLHVGYNKQRIRLTNYILAEYFETDQGTILRCIQRLISLNVLAHKAGDIYWINHNLFFSGNRLKHCVDFGPLYDQVNDEDKTNTKQNDE